MSDELPGSGRVLLVVDAANVVGSVPDGWWRDRASAAERLRDSLACLAGDPPGWLQAYGVGVEVVLVVEGRARNVPSVDGVRVVGTDGSGDDAIVQCVTEARAADAGRRCVVVTADRELRSRVGQLGAEVTGPRSVWPPSSHDHEGSPSHTDGKPS